uniref:Uncharacterized protein n=1 Tax=Anopheles coluzzii TaxID=1518534 RepID=A0A8W7PB96_ANOCL
MTRADTNAKIDGGENKNITGCKVVRVRLHPQPPEAPVGHAELALELLRVPLVAELQQLAHHRVQRQPEEVLLVLVLQQLLVPDQLLRLVRQVGLDRLARLAVVAADVRYRRVQVAELERFAQRQLGLRQEVVLLRVDVLQRGQAVQLAVLLVQVLGERVAPDRHVELGERGRVLHLEDRHMRSMSPDWVAAISAFSHAPSFSSSGTCSFFFVSISSSYGVRG